MTTSIEDFLFGVHSGCIKLDRPIWIMAYECNEMQYTYTPYTHIKPQIARIVVTELKTHNGLTKFEYSLVTQNNVIQATWEAYYLKPLTSNRKSHIFVSFDKDKITKHYNDLVMTRYFNLLHIKLNIDQCIEDAKNDLFETDIIMETLMRGEGGNK